MSHFTLLPTNMCPPLFTAIGAQGQNQHGAKRSRRSAPGYSTRPPSC